LPDVARAAGVSRSTASRVLGGYGPVSDEARRRVLEAAEALGYRPNSLARSMVTGRTRALGLVIADVQNPFFAAVTSGFAATARAGGYDTVIVTTEEDARLEDDGIEALQSRRVDGLAVASSHVAAPAWAGAALGRPVVLVDRRPPGVRLDFVGVDNRALAGLAVDHLAGLGHRRIGLVAGATPQERASRLMSTTEDRVAGFREALARHGIADDPSLVRVGDFDVPGARAEAARLLASPEPPTAVVGADVVLTVGVLLAVREAGWPCPGRVSVVSIDDADWAPVVDPPLTTVRQPACDIGSTAADLLLDRIDRPSAELRDRQLPVELVVRASTASPPGHGG
jgi:LacI family transcriptional regulator